MWGSYTWDPNLFFDHLATLDWLHSIGLFVSVNTHDCIGSKGTQCFTIANTEEQYPYVAQTI